jgi:hypothetical protein
MTLTSLPVVAGIAATTIFAGSTLPMLAKAARTRDLGSYSLGNLAMANAGNLVHSLYVFSLPAGPLWILHTFNLASSLLMLVWFLRYEWRPRIRSDEPELGGLNHDGSAVGQPELREDGRDVVVSRLG